MAANSYYNQSSHITNDYDHDRQHLLSPSMSSPGLSSGHPSPLKPLHLLSPKHNSGFNHTATFNNFDHLQDASYEDAILKSRIRRLRLISRVLACLVSIAVLVPITMTLIKFTRTKNTYRPVTQPNGHTVTRTAWAKDTRAWPTWMYFSVAAVSVLLNFLTIFSYRFGVDKANVASYVTSTFSWVVMLGNLIVWSVAAGMYRGEKDKGGKSNDLWGWTCSPAARAIQREFVGEVDFNRFCDVQSASWYAGLAQAAAALVTVAVYVMVLMRRRSKKNLKRQLRLSGFEPARR